jgi:hypothetical protein
MDVFRAGTLLRPKGTPRVFLRRDKGFQHPKQKQWMSCLSLSGRFSCLTIIFQAIYHRIKNEFNNAN